MRLYRILYIFTIIDIAISLYHILIVCQEVMFIFFKNFKFLKKKSGKSLKKISQESEVYIRTLENISSGKTLMPKFDTINKLTKYFNVSLDDFMYKDLEELEKQKNDI